MMDASCAESSEKELIELSGLPLYLVDVVVGGAELVAVGSVGRGAGQFHLVAGSVRVHPVALLAANTNCESFVSHPGHGPWVVTRHRKRHPPFPSLPPLPYHMMENSILNVLNIEI